MEILVVVLIIGILASIAVMPFIDTEANVKQRAIRADLHMVRAQLQLYRFKEGSYPPSIAALTAAGYLSTEPMHPAPGSYVYDSLGGSFTSSLDGTW